MDTAYVYWHVSCIFCIKIIKNMKGDFVMRKCLKITMVMISITVFFGCGVKQVTPPFEAPDLSMKLKSGDYTQKVDNFLVLLDASHSMRDKYNNKKKFCLAKQAAYALNDTIAGLELKGGLRLFGNIKVFSANTSLVCPMTDYSAEEFGQCLDKLRPSFASTPLYKALMGACDDIENLEGKTAIIIISDGISTGKSPADAVKMLKDKYGDKVCISTIGIAGGGVLNSISNASKCGVAMSYENVNTAEGMEMFAE